MKKTTGLQVLVHSKSCVIRKIQSCYRVFTLRDESEREVNELEGFSIVCKDYLKTELSERLMNERRRQTYILRLLSLVEF